MNKTQDRKVRLLFVTIFMAILILVLLKFNVVSFNNNKLPEAISLNQVEIGLKTNSNYQLVANVYPLDSYYGHVTWKSSNNDIVNVTSNGNLQAIKEGDSTITATIPYNDLSVSCLVHVSNDDILITDLVFTSHEVYLTKNGEYQINYQLYPLNGNYRSIRFVSSDNNIVTVDNNGLIKAHNNGEAYVKAYVQDKEDTIKVVVSDTRTLSNTIKEPEIINLSVNNVSLSLNGRIKVNSEVLPESAISDVTWETLNSNIATVSNGEIKAVGYGKTQVVAKTVNGLTSIVNVNVIKAKRDIERIELENNVKVIFLGREYPINVKIYPSNATDQTLIYDIKDKNIIKVENNKMIGLNEGETELTIRTNNNISETMTVSVIRNPNKVVIDSFSMKVDTIKLVKGETKRLDYSVEPINATIDNLTWSSSNPNIIKVSNDGLIEAVGVGKASIYVVDNDVIKKIEVEVVDKKLAALITDQSYINLHKGETVGLTIAYVPKDITKVDLSYASSDSSVATVSGGIVKGISPGKAIITISSGDVSLDIIVEVKEN